MPIDLNRVLEATAEAVLEGQGSGSAKPSNESGKRRPRIPRAFLIGAGVFAAGRLVTRARGRDMLENLQQRLVELEQRHFEADDEDGYDEDFDDEEPYDEDDEEPEAEEDEDFDEEEPEGEEDDEEEPEAEEGEDFEEEEEEPEGEEDEEEPEEEKPIRRTRSASGNRG